MVMDFMEKKEIVVKGAFMVCSIFLNYFLRDSFPAPINICLTSVIIDQ